MRRQGIKPTYTKTKGKPMAREFTNQDDVIDSRDVIARIEELEDERDSLAHDEPTRAEAESALAAWDAGEEGQELKALKALAEEGEGSPDWSHGETLIREDHFTDYIEQLVDDCYEMPKEMKSGEWPWRHVTIDWQAAADEARADYIEVDFDGVTYLIRA